MTNPQVICRLEDLCNRGFHINIDADQQGKLVSVCKSSTRKLFNSDEVAGPKRGFLKAQILKKSSQEILGGSHVVVVPSGLEGALKDGQQ